MITPSNAMEVLVAAHELGVTALLPDCCAVITRTLTRHSCIASLNLAVRVRMEMYCDGSITVHTCSWA